MSSAQVLSRGHNGLLTAWQEIWLFVTACRKSCRESGVYGWEESVADQMTVDETRAEVGKCFGFTSPCNGHIIKSVCFFCPVHIASSQRSDIVVQL